MYTINCKGKLLTTEIPLIMGIINASPDSFYNLPQHTNVSTMLALADSMLTEGADILDIGGLSTKPNSTDISVQQELDRTIPIIEAIHKAYPHCIVSIDTYKSEVAVAAIHAGVSMVNDISAGEADEAMIPLVAAFKNIPYIAMHKRGNALTMQFHTDYDNVLETVIAYFVKKIAQCKEVGITDLIIDPGFGFAKTTMQNYELLKNLQIFDILAKPILVGLSRKSMVYKPLSTTAEQALNGTTVLHTIALQQGANILRVHDVKAAKEAVTLTQLLQ